ncbi:DUF6529 family protein [Mycolicibacterium sp. 120266]|jgi:hypothetical protein|uniref:DUF6529 family protein n=1 Tax=Mycolicibacterium sp. 120266 TaxID=3090601 RepID=UPI00299EADD6|nr:DUF6529 family protein [Mycolicibacterium sp. 120266]MDX1873098.1 DUF6529 family protein [Mycolicibacterium sp. 120266]
MRREYAEADTRLLAAPRAADTALLGALAIGAVVAVGLGVYGRLHTPQFFAVNIGGFSGPGAVKSWLATIAVALAVFQFISALVMYRVLPGGRAPSWIGVAHVWSGRLAVLASVPVAVHCLYALGFQATDSRVLWHSLFGCFFYGAFVAKMILLTRKNLRAWVIPVLGGLVFFTLVNIWLTSALWFFQINGLAK